MASALDIARTIDPTASDKTDYLFGYMILCRDVFTASHVADVLSASGFDVVYSAGINGDHLFIR